ncbi:uncharacterized protein LOC129248683 [Anastrepha obliqua]|uniref:uncharacterized protein LOC129248683 n=1 Tax=Anastrepha obliqua TaxID=95512 RepID=UPI0024094D41|nr:uncharacterized protein LOC129248683 [Anastrepha obliqua]
MNEYVLRCYYISTNCEEPEHMTTYRERMLDLFLRRYRHLNGKLTENSLATRKKAIFQHEYVRKEKQEEFKSAIRNELRGVEGSEEEITPEITEARNPQPENLAEFTNVQPEINLIHESIESDGPETNEEREVKDIFLNYLTNYEDMDPLLRQRIPRLGESEKLNEVVKTLNSKILPAYVANSTNLEYVNTLFYVSALTTARLLGKHPKVQTFKNKTTQKTPVVPRWQRRLETRIAGLRESIGRLTSFKNGAKSKRLLRHVSRIIAPLKPQTVGLDQLSEIIDRKVQQLAAYSKRLSKRYLKSNQRRKENQLFHKNQKSIYRNLQQNSNAESQTLYPQQQELEQFWEKIWAQAKHFNADANWLAKEKEKADNVAPMHFYYITAEEIKNNICTSANWKSPGLDQLHNIWLKKLSVMHEALARCYNELLKNIAAIPEFLTAGVTYLLPKDAPSADPARYRPITCLSTTYKLLTKIIANRIYEHCESNSILCEEQKGCRKRTMGCKDQLIIDTVITGVALRRRRNLSVAFIDYKKAFDSMPHDYLLEILRIYKIDAATVALLGRIMSKWNTKLVLNGTVSKQISIKRGIFQGDALSPLSFCIGLNPLSRLLTLKQNGFILKTELPTLRNISRQHQQTTSGDAAASSSLPSWSTSTAVCGDKTEDLSNKLNISQVRN